jgi:hypothetical protein
MVYKVELKIKDEKSAWEVVHVEADTVELAMFLALESQKEKYPDDELVVKSIQETDIVLVRVVVNQ